MLLLSCCTSCQKKEKNAIPNDIYFPAFPDAQTGTILFLDMHGKRVSYENPAEVVNVAMPLWYWLMICDYVEQTEDAVQSLNLNSSKKKE